MRVADTSFLYSALDEADARHSAAGRQLSNADPILVPLPVWTEFLDLLGYRRGREVAAAAEATFSQFPHVAVRHAGDPDAVTRLWRAHPELSMADCVGIQACLETGADLLSYDADQLAAMPKR